VSSETSKISGSRRLTGDVRKRQGELPLNDERRPAVGAPEPSVKRPQYPVWTENKAKLIERYLYYFVLITRHGTYIDGFAGPQRPGKPSMWAAKLVLESQPRWLRHFHLCDRSRNKFKFLWALRRSHVGSHRREVNREIHLYCGDFNDIVHRVLGAGEIGQREATFCLLDQQTFECDWSTVKALAAYKCEGNLKIELFYFLAVGWIARAFSGVKKEQTLRNWWGRPDWADIRKMDSQQLRDEFVRRFKDELGYKSAKAWPIFDRPSGGAIMYYMIHAADHPEAPRLMARAYQRAVGPRETYRQLRMELGVESPGISENPRSEER
jgi:three-Cys-motif partner protein